MVSNVGRSLDDFSIPTSQRAVSEELGQEDFLKLMVEQMRNQNPLDPQDNSEFFNQIAQFQTLDAMNVISEAITTLVEISGLSNASSLIGRSIVAEIEQRPDPTTGFPRPPQEVSGLVERVTFDENGAVLHVGELSIPAAAVVEISEPAAAPAVDPTAALLAQLEALGALGSAESEADPDAEGAETEGLTGADGSEGPGTASSAGDIAAELLAQIEALAALGLAGAEPDDPAADADSVAEAPAEPDAVGEAVPEEEAA